MTAGSSILRYIAWPGKSKKGKRSGLEELENKAGQKEGRMRKLSGLSLQSITSIFSPKEQISSPNQTNQFECSWPVKGLTKNNESSGLNSKHFKIEMNGVTSVWNLSIRFWTNEQGKQIFNPFIICLNLLESKSSSGNPVEMTYKFGIYNRAEKQYEEGQEGVTSVVLDRSDQIQSVGVENVTLKDENYNEDGDLLLKLSLSFNWKPSKNKAGPKVPRYLESQTNKPDLVIVSGSRLFPVNKQVLAAASPLLCSLIQGLEESKEGEILSRYEEALSYHQRDSNEHLIQNVSSDLGQKKKPMNHIDDKPVDRIVIPDLPESTVATILDYIYTGSAPGSSACSPSLLTACTLYQLPGLQSLCEEHLATLLTPNTVASLLMLADSCSCHWLRGRALQYCREHCAYIIKDDDWTVMEQDNHCLWVEACRQVEVDTCIIHEECVKNTRYRVETKIMEEWAR